MKIRIEEQDPQRLRDLARAWGVKAVDGQHPDVLAVAIAAAYRRIAEKEDKMGHDKYEAADAAMHRAFDAAERVAVLLDRHAYDNGDDPAPIEGWTDRLRQLEREIVKTLGEPRRRLPCGGLVPSRDPRMGAKL